MVQFHTQVAHAEHHAPPAQAKLPQSERQVNAFHASWIALLQRIVHKGGERLLRVRRRAVLRCAAPLPF